MPGTDGALALGLMHVIFRDGLEDRDYLERYTVGADALRERVRGMDARRAPRRSTGLARRGHRVAARASTRPASPSAIRLNYGLNRHAGGGHGGAHDRLPARGDRGLAPSPAAASCSRARGRSRRNAPALERPDLAPPGDAPRST